MLMLFQKYHTQLNLMLLALLGLSCGLLAGTLLESSIDPGPHGKTRTTPVPAHEATGATQADLNLILQRNIFDPAGRSAATFDLGLHPATATNKTAAAQKQDMVLFGTAVADDKSLALIRIGKELAAYHLDEKLPNGGQVEEIRRNLVKIRNRDRSLTTLEISETPGSTAPAASAPGAASDIRQIDDNRWLIPRQTAEKTRQNLSEELRLAQMQPRIVEGKINGFMIRTIKRRSLLNKLGLRRGDVILSVNETTLDSPEKALQIFQQLREARQINVAVERQGKALNFAYELD
jgi:general secretion pathway protein C